MRPGGELLQAGDRLEQPGLVEALEALADDAAAVYRGAIAAELLALSEERGGLLTRMDFDVVRAAVERPGRSSAMPAAVL